MIGIRHVNSGRTKEMMSENKTGQGKEKIVYFEICRIIALFCIMYQHTGGRGADAWKYTESIWVFVMSLTGRIVSSIGVPLFWMVSGALLLPKKETWEKVYRNRVPRIAKILGLFSVVRYLYQCIMQDQKGGVGEFLRLFYTQEIFLPYWFLYEYLGILFLLPFLRKMMQNLTEREERIFFLLLLGWNILNDFSNVYLRVGFVLNLHFQSSVSYFILGYLMENCRMLRESKRRELVAAIGQLVFAGAVLYRLWGVQNRSETFEGFIMLLTLSVYYLNRYMAGKKIWSNTTLHRFIIWCGSNVFGIYLIEDYLRNATAVIWEWIAPLIGAVPACCVWLLSVFFVGNVLISEARRVPILKNFL